MLYIIRSGVCAAFWHICGSGERVERRRSRLSRRRQRKRKHEMGSNLADEIQSASIIQSMLGRRRRACAGCRNRSAAQWKSLRVGAEDAHTHSPDASSALCSAGSRGRTASGRLASPDRRTRHTCTPTAHSFTSTFVSPFASALFLQPIGSRRFRTRPSLIAPSLFAGRRCDCDGLRWRCAPVAPACARPLARCAHDGWPSNTHFLH